MIQKGRYASMAGQLALAATKIIAAPMVVVHSALAFRNSFMWLSAVFSIVTFVTTYNGIIFLLGAKPGIELYGFHLNISTAAAASLEAILLLSAWKFGKSKSNKESVSIAPLLILYIITATTSVIFSATFIFTEVYEGRDGKVGDRVSILESFLSPSLNRLVEQYRVAHQLARTHTFNHGENIPSASDSIHAGYEEVILAVRGPANEFIKKMQNKPSAKAQEKAIRVEDVLTNINNTISRVDARLRVVATGDFNNVTSKSTTTLCKELKIEISRIDKLTGQQYAQTLFSDEWKKKVYCDRDPFYQLGQNPFAFNVEQSRM